MIMDKEKYENFFTEIRKFKQEQNKQKQRGLNNYNLLTTVLKADDEVRLHSRMIRSLLDINGEHYQHTLFLEIFLDILKLDDFELNIDSVKVYTEYHDIDIYITDGTKHIILENKIWAKDQPCQIIKYINIIKEENELQTDKSDISIIEDIYVLYLTPNDKKISYEHNFKNDYIFFSGDEKKLEECSSKSNTKKLVKDGLKNYQVKYKKITYKKEIKEWLVKSKDEVQNITNLNEAIKQYIDVVDKINGEYKGKVMDLKNLLKEDREKFKLAQEISKAYELADIEIKRETQKLFWKYLQEKLQNKGFDFDFVSGDYSKIDIDNKVSNYWNIRGKTYHFGLKYDVKDIDINYKLSFFIEVNENIYYGFTISKDENRSNFTQNKECEEISLNVLENLKDYKWKETYKENDWWTCWKYPSDKFNFRNFQGKGIDNLLDGQYTSLDTMINEIITIIERVKNL